MEEDALISSLLTPHPAPPCCPAMPTPSKKPVCWIGGDSSNSSTSGGNHLCLQASHYRSGVWDCSDKSLSPASRPAREQHATSHSLLYTFATVLSFLFPTNHPFFDFIILFFYFFINQSRFKYSIPFFNIFYGWKYKKEHLIPSLKIAFKWLILKAQNG